MKKLHLILLCIFAAPLAQAAPKSAPVPANVEIVQLPTYTVTDSRILPPPEDWLYAAVPGYEIISDASERNTKRFIDEFQRFRIGVQLIWPDLVNSKPTVPTLILICARNSFKPFVPSNPDPEAYITNTSIFVEDKERGAIVIDFATNEIFNNSDFTTITVDPYKEFYRQHTRFLMRRANDNKPIPAWLESGLSQIATTLDLDKKSVEFGRLPEEGFAQGVNTKDETIAEESRGTSSYVLNPFDANTNFGWLNQRTSSDDFPGATPSANRSIPNQSSSNANRSSSDFQPVTWVFPIEGLFDPGSEHYKDSNWSRECYAFVHMCLYGYQKKYQKAFISFARQALAGPVTDEDFKKYFGRSYAQMTKVLRSYISTPNHQYVLLKTKPGSAPLPKPELVTLREATDAETGRIKGETLRLAGHAGESREAFIAPYIRKHADPALLASLGLLETLEGRKDRARKFLEAAAKENVVRPRAYLELARLRYEESLAAPKAEGGKFDAAQTASILDVLFTARSQPPAMPEVYLLIADTWRHSAVRPQPGNLDVLLEATLRFPKNTALILQAAELHAQNGDTQTAGRLINIGIAVSSNAATRKQFEALRSTLPGDKS